MRNASASSARDDGAEAGGIPTRHPGQRTAALAGIPLGFARRSAVGWGRRLVGGDAEQISADLARRGAEEPFTVLSQLKGSAMKFGQALSVFEAAVPAELARPYRDALTSTSGSNHGPYRGWFWLQAVSGGVACLCPALALAQIAAVHSDTGGGGHDRDRRGPVPDPLLRHRSGHEPPTAHGIMHMLLAVVSSGGLVWRPPACGRPLSRDALAGGPAAPGPDRALAARRE